ncbi:hypothetical protein EYB25_006384 [Talaromyces marneffei]|nr:hypothetical protein EYB25_006384 [Talaromyces marneffei]
MPETQKQEQMSVQPPGFDLSEKTMTMKSTQLPETDGSESANKSLEADGQGQEDDYISGIRFYMVNTAVTLAAALLFLDTAIIATAIPRITDQFNSLADVGWYGGAYQLGSATLLPLTGKIYHYFSSKWTFLIFFTLFEIGSVLCGAATSSAMLIVGRAIAGMGGAGIISGALTIIASCMPLNKRATATGIMMGVSQLGVVLGPLIGGAFTQRTTWRWCFYINLPLGGVCILFLLGIHIPDQVKKPNPLVVLRNLHHHLDLIGFVLFAGSVIQLLLAVELGGNRFAWNSATIIGLFCGAGATFLLWFSWNWRLGDEALIPKSMTSKRPVWASCLMQALSMVTLFVVSYFLPTYFQAVQNRSPLLSGVQLLPSIIGQLIFAVLSGILVSKTGFVIPYAFIGAVLGAIGSGLFTTLVPDSSLGKWFGYQVLSGVGRGMVMQMPIIAMQASLEPKELSMANSLMMFAQSLLTSILLVVGNTVLDESLRTEIPKFAPNANVPEIIAAGATAFRSVVSTDELAGVIRAYSNSLDKVFYIGAVCASLACLVTPAMGWVDIRNKGPKSKAGTTSEESALESDEKVADDKTV